MPTMSGREYTIYDASDDGTSIFLVADMLAWGWNWPLSIDYMDATYVFKTNEVMEDWMVGNYSGHAKFVKKD